jgi:hypothetical protein
VVVVANDVRTVRPKLAAYMRAQAAWRARLASRDSRSAAAHRRSADAIEAWARYVQALPDDDPNLAAIAAGQALIGSPPQFRPRSDSGAAMIRQHGYPNTVAWDEETGAIDPTIDLATPEPPPNETLMAELAKLEGPPGPAQEVAYLV